MVSYTTQALLLLSSYAASSASAFDVISLTPENYEAETNGKTVFIKFFAPWCGHCKKMAPDWEKLAEEWSGHATGLIAEVDCTTAGKPLCEENGVRGFPTLKWGDPAGLTDYEGSRGYDDLADFAKANLKPMCSANNIDLCDAEKKAQLESYMQLSLDELKEAVGAEEKKLEAAESDFKDEVTKLQAAYQKLSEEKDKKLAEVKESGLSLMKSVLSVKKKSASNDEL